MHSDLLAKQNTLAVIGLGYVGLPIALEFGRHYRVLGYDINAGRIELMRKGIDPSAELEPEAFLGSDIVFSSSFVIRR